MPSSTTGTLAANACQDVNVPIVPDPPEGFQQPLGNAAKLRAPFTACHGKEHPCNCMQNIFLENHFEDPD